MHIQQFALIVVFVSVVRAAEVFWKSPPDEGSYYGSCIQYDDNGPTTRWRKAFPDGLTMGKGKHSGKDVTLTIEGVEPNSQCAVAEISDCYFNIKHIEKITFDYEISGCYDVWVAPLWFTRAYYGCGGIHPDKYALGYGTNKVPPPCSAAGEIDVAETGEPGHKWMWTNFAGGPVQEQRFEMDKNNQKTHKATMTVDIDEAGYVKITSSSSTNDRNGDTAYFGGRTSKKSLYTGPVAKANGCEDDGPKATVNEWGEANRCMYKFASDIWNSDLGHMEAGHKAQDACTVSVKNLKMKARKGKELHDIFKKYTKNFKKNSLEKNPSVTQEPAPDHCRQLLDDQGVQSEIREDVGVQSEIREDVGVQSETREYAEVASTANSSHPRLDVRILAFGVLGLAALMLYATFGKNARNNGVYQTLVDMDKDEI